MSDQQVIAYVSPGGLRDNVYHAFLHATSTDETEGLVSLNGARKIWVTRSEQEHQRVINSGYESVFLRDSLSSCDTRLLESCAVSVHSTHMYSVRANDCLIQTLLSGSKKVQLWHGIPAKTVGVKEALRKGNPYSENKEELQKFLDDCYSYDYVVSEHPKLNPIYQKSFPRATVICLGSTRMDALLDNFRVIKTDVLLAPTYREPYQGQGSMDHFTELVQSLVASGNWVIVKPHPADSLEWFPQTLKRVTLVDPSCDTVSLMQECNSLVTDYSSIAFDFCLTGRTIVHYIPDLAEFEKTRDQEVTKVLSCGTQANTVSGVMRALADQLPSSHPYVSKEHTSGARERVSAFLDSLLKDKSCGKK